MNKMEVITEIKSRVKPYIGIMPQSTFSRTLSNIEHGMAKPKTIDKFFAVFGYKADEVNYNKCDL